MSSTKAPEEVFAHWKIDLVRVDQSGNPRAVLGDLSELVASIKQHGIVQPLIVRPDDDPEFCHLVAGHRRLAAARAAGLTEVPVVMTGDAADLPAVTLIENLQRLDLTALDEAKAFKKLLGKGMTQKKLAARIGKSPAYVSSRLRILDLPEATQQAVGLGLLPPSITDKLIYIANVSPALADAIVTLLLTLDGHDRADQVRELNNDAGGFIAELENLWLEVFYDEEDAPQLPFYAPISVGRSFVLSDIFEDEGHQRIAEQYAGLMAAAAKHWGAYNAQPAFDQADVDAARSYGCLLEYESTTWRHMSWVTDQAWLRSHVENVTLPRVTEQWTELFAESDARQDEPNPERTPAPAPISKEDKQNARLANANLGVAIERDLPGRLDRLAVAKAAACYVIQRDGRALIASLMQTDGQINQANGKTQEAELAEFEKKVAQSIEDAFDVDDVLVMLGKLFVAGAAVDWTGAPTATRFSWYMPGTYTDGLPKRLVADPVREITYPLLGAHHKALWDAEAQRQRENDAVRAARVAADGPQGDEDGVVEGEQGSGIPAVGEPPADEPQDDDGE